METVEITERRRTRSSEPMEALSLFFAQKRAEANVRAFTLGTRDGRLLAGAGDDLEDVADLGGLVDRGHVVTRGALRVATWRMKVGTEDVIVTSWGGTLSADFADTVRRILG